MVIGKIDGIYCNATYPYIVISGSGKNHMNYIINVWQCASKTDPRKTTHLTSLFHIIYFIAELRWMSCLKRKDVGMRLV